MSDTPNQTDSASGSTMQGEKNSGGYRVLARKYRPQNFDDLIGQAPMVRTLTNAFETGRIAQAYMLTGVRGVGKTTTARILARALNYKTSEIDRPAIDVKELGEHCQAIIDGRHVDVIEMDAASHTGIDDIREIIESAQYNPASARYKVYVIDEVHMLSKNAFNGLLKTLEEPPAHLKFIFATTEIRKVPVTVLSRCQRFDLRRIDGDDMVAYLKKISDSEAIEVEDEALAVIARASEGSVRDALSMLDQAIASGSSGDETKVTAEATRQMLGLADRARIVDLFEHVMHGRLAEALSELKAQYDIGADPVVVLTDLADFIHFVTKLKYVPSISEDLSLSEIERTKGKAFADSLSVRVLGRAWQILLKGISEVQQTERAITAAEMVLVRLTHASTLPSPEEVIKGLENGAPSSSSAGQPVTAGNGMSSNSPRTNVQAERQDSGSPMSAGGAQNATAAPTDPSMLLVQNTEKSAAVAGTAVPLEQPTMERQPESAPASSGVEINSFDELIFVCEDKRELQLKTYIRRHVRLVSFANGKIEFAPANNPPPNFMTTLAAKLLEWTGKRWMIATSQAEGQPTLEEVEAAETNAKMDEARNDPTVTAILAKFPGSRIVDVRLRAPEAEIPPAPPEDDDEAPTAGDETLDDFF